VHAEFNRRPDLSVPLDAEKGDDQDEWAYLFGRLLDDAKNRGLDQDEFYFIDDHMLRFFVKVQRHPGFRPARLVEDERHRILPAQPA